MLQFVTKLVPITAYFFCLDTVAITPSLDSAVAREQPPDPSYNPAPSDGSPEAAESRLYQKLAEVNRRLQANTSTATQQHPTAPLSHSDAGPQTVAMPNTDRLEEILSHTGTNKGEAETELGQINAMMDKSYKVIQILLQPCQTY